jgi:hypothetical protein
MAKRQRQQIVFPREVLLVEIERRCPEEACNARNRIGLTRAEARVYRGYECARCERWHEDALTERDVPDWWEELSLTSLAQARTHAQTGETPGQSDADGAGGVVARLSTAWREHGAAADTGDATDAEAGER